MDRFERLPDMACEVTPELKQRIADANREAHALHLAVFPTVYVGTKVTDFDGNVLSPYKEYKANSFNRNFWNIVTYLLTGTLSAATAYGEGYINLRSGASNYRALGGSYLGYFYPMSGTDGNRGLNLAYTGGSIIVGSGDSAEDFDGYALSSEIAAGTGSGQLTRLDPVMSTTPSYDSETKKYTSVLSRVFKNTSGASIDVKESGLKMNNLSAPVLIERTVFPETKTVNNNQQIEVTYTFEFTFPEPAV